MQIKMKTYKDRNVAFDYPQDWKLSATPKSCEYTMKIYKGLYLLLTIGGTYVADSLLPKWKHPIPPEGTTCTVLNAYAYGGYIGTVAIYTQTDDKDKYAGKEFDYLIERADYCILFQIMGDCDFDELDYEWFMRSLQIADDLLLDH